MHAHVIQENRSHIPKIRELSAPSTLPWIADALLDWLWISGMFFLVATTKSLLVVLIALFVIGNRQHAIAILGHDGAHYTINRNQKLNDFLSNIFCFWPLLITTQGYRKLHSKHHKHTSHADDPELLHKGARSPQWDLPLQKKKIGIYAVKDLFGYSLPDLLILLTFSKPENTKDYVPILFFQTFFILVPVFAGLWWMPVLWYASFATTFMMFFRLRIWLEHQGTTSTQRLKLNALQGLLLAPHKTWLHWEHHNFPALPYHRLEQARVILQGAKIISLSELIEDLENADFLPSGTSMDIAEIKAA